MSEVYEFFNSTLPLILGRLISILVIFLTVNYKITIVSLFYDASETEYYNSTPDFSEWSRTNLIWVTVDETWLDCGSLFFLLQNGGTPVDPTLSSRRDTTGTDHKWTELWFLTMLNDNLPIPLIRRRDFQGNLYHLLTAAWDTNS